MGVSKLHGRIARAAVSVALSGAMALGGVAGPITTAFAAAAQGKIKVDVSADTTAGVAQVSSFNAIQVFAGTVKNGAMSDPSWSAALKKTDGVVRDEIITFLEGASGTEYTDWLKANNYLVGDPNATELTDARTAPRNALAFISEMISGSDGATTGGSTGTKKAGSGTFADNFANKLQELATATTDAIGHTAIAVSSGTTGQTTLDTGYWMLMPCSDASGENRAGGNVPLWLPVESGTSILEATSKATPSTIEKKVSEKRIAGKLAAADAAHTLDKYLTNYTFNESDFVEYIDTGINSERSSVMFMLKAHVSTTGKAFKITDTVPEGIDLFSGVASGVEKKTNVKLVSQPAVGSGETALAIGTSSSTGFKVDYTDNKLTITADAGVISKAGDYVFLYTARLTNAATTGTNAFNTNKAVLEYNGDVSVENNANIGTYRMKINCIDATNDAGIKGATFSIRRAVDGAYLQGDGTFVKAEGEEANWKYLFTAGDDGSITTPFIDNSLDEADGDNVNGMYIVTEENVPDGYSSKLPTYERTAAGYSATTNTTAESAKIHAFKVYFGKAFDTETGEKNANWKADVSDDGDVVTSVANADEGLIELTIPNTKEINLPVTGMTPSQLGTLIGGALIAAGAVAIAARRRDEDAEQA